MKKFGFTLAEVLITLGIIGVVAALTTPALVKNSGQAKIGPALAKFVNTFEVATEQMMLDESINKISSLGLTKDQLMDKLSNYIVMSKTENQLEIANMNTASPRVMGFGTAYQLKDGSIMSLDDSGLPGKFTGTSTGAYKGIKYIAYVDINGANGNNIAGKEVFAFYLDDSGVLIPVGSNTEYSLFGKHIKTCNLKNNNTFPYNSGIGCTGKIADNGWKADY